MTLVIFIKLELNACGDASKSRDFVDQKVANYIMPLIVDGQNSKYFPGALVPAMVGPR